MQHRQIQQDVPWENVLIEQLYPNMQFRILDGAFQYKEVFLEFLEESKLSHLLEIQESKGLQKDGIQTEPNREDIDIKNLLGLVELCEELREQYETMFDNIQQLNIMLESQKDQSQLITPKYSFKFGSKLLDADNQHTLLDVFVMSAITQCKIWKRVYWDYKQHSDKIYNISQWYEDIYFTLGQGNETVPYLIEQNRITSRKTQKKAITEKIQQQANDEIIQAVMNNDTTQVKELLESGVSVETVEIRQGMRPAHIACENQNIGLCRILDSFQVNWESEDFEKLSPLFYAIKTGDFSIIQYLVEEKKVDIQHGDIQNRSPFYWACSQGEYFIEIGSNVNSVSSQNRTALTQACFLGRMDIVNYLLSIPAIDMYIQDEKGRNALHNAVFGSRGGREGQKIGTYDSDCPIATQTLLERGYPVDSPDFQQFTPLHVAASSDGRDSARVLIAFGAKINSFNIWKETPLMVALKHGHIEFAQMLIEEYSAGLWIKNNQGGYEIDVILREKQFQSFSYFINYFFSVRGNLETELSYGDLILTKTIEFCSQQESNQSIDFFNLLIKVVEENKISNYFQFQEEIFEISLKSKDSKLFSRLLHIFSREIKEDEKQLADIIYLILKLKKPALFFNQFYQIFNASLNSINFGVSNPLFNVFFDLVFLLGDQEIFNLITKLNVDVLNYRDCINGNNFLHQLVDGTKLQTILNLFKIFSGKFKPNNKYLIDLNTEIIKNLFQHKNCYTLNSYQLAYEKVLKERLIQNEKQESASAVQNVLQDYYDNFFKINVDLQYVLPHIIEIEITKVYDNNEGESNWFKHHHSERIKQINNEIKKLETHSLQYQNRQQSEKLVQKEILTQHIQANQQKIHEFIFDAQRSLYFIDNETELKDRVLGVLDQSSVIGVDIEWYTELIKSNAKDSNEQEKKTNEPSYNYEIDTSIKDSERVFYVCILQISTSSHDFVIDAIRLRTQLKTNLKKYFQDWSQIKIFHSGETDIKLLKKEFNFNTVNIFDTAQCEMKMMNEKQCAGLNGLTSKYLLINLDQSFQISDWRIRPLPQSMLEYARNDSRMLIYLFFVMYSQMRENQDSTLLNQYITASNEVCVSEVEQSIDLQRIDLKVK